MLATEVLDEAKALNAERHAIYGDGFKKQAAAMAAMYPDGLTLRTEEDFARFYFVSMNLTKILRYVEGKPHEDSLRDLTVYAALLHTYDREMGAYAGK